jgi:hypothetical protein
VNFDESLANIPVLAQVVGAQWIARASRWFSGAEDMPHPVWYEQAELDLAVLAQKVPLQKLVSCYRAMLRDRNALIDAIYEIHGAAFLAGIAGGIDLHVPRSHGVKVNYDVRAEIDGVAVHADCKARRDDFPFKHHLKDPEGGFFGSRATLDRNDPDALGLTQGAAPRERNYAITPESTVVRQVLADALTQLPDAGVNLVLFGQVYGSREHLERALFRGAPVAEVLTDRVTKEYAGTQWRQVGSTVFADPSFARLSGVLWMRLTHLEGPLLHHYNLYVNPNATMPIPSAVVEALEQEIKRASSPDG